MFAAFTLAFLFILKLRFPKNLSIKDIITRRYGNNTLALFRQYERTKFKLEKAKLDISFLQECDNSKVYPKFLQFKVSASRLRCSSAYKQCQSRLLRAELRSKFLRVRKMSQYFDDLKQQLRSTVSWLDFHHLTVTVDRLQSKPLMRASDVQKSKLLRLRLLQNTVGTSQLDPDKLIFNFSSRQLSQDEKLVLCNGLNYSLPPRRLGYANYLCPFEKLFRDIKLLPVVDMSTISRTKARLQDVALTAIYTYNSNCIKSNVDKDGMKLLRSLANDKSIVVLKPDKGNGVVILDRTDYSNKVHSILTQDGKFSKVNNEDPYESIVRLECKLISLLKKLKSSGSISHETYRDLYPSGSRPGILYGLPKVHKDNCPIRPIISAIGSFNHKMAQYLVKLLSPLSVNEYTIRNTFTFLDDLRSISLNDDMYMCSFDVVSLFTNVPLNETIEICTEAVSDSTSAFTLPFDGATLKDLLDLCTKDSVFIFDKQLYRQVDGVAMGSPLGPLLANVFMCFSEKKWLSNCPGEFKPIYYRRYVDDSFVIFKAREHAQQFLHYLNAQHNNIKFTCETERNGVLPFLDVNIRRAECFHTSVYRKPTFTGLYTNFSSFIPDKYKVNLAKSLFYRSYKICSNLFSVDFEFKYIAKVLYDNGFPKKVVDNCIKSVLDRIYQPKTSNPTVPRKEIMLNLPFTGKHGTVIGNKLTKFLSRLYPMAKFRVVFSPTFKIGNLFRAKDGIPSSLQSMVIYEFRCSSCNARYVGQTTRHLQTRIAEHMGISSRTQRSLSAPLFSSIRDHSHKTGHTFNESHFRILNKARNKYDLGILESLVITNTRPNLNIMQNSTELSLF